MLRTIFKEIGVEYHANRITDIWWLCKFTEFQPKYTVRFLLRFLSQTTYRMSQQSVLYLKNKYCTCSTFTQELPNESPVFLNTFQWWNFAMSKIQYIENFIDVVGNLEDLPRLVFINEGCENFKVANDGVLKRRRSQMIYGIL